MHRLHTVVIAAICLYVSTRFELHAAPEAELDKAYAAVIEPFMASGESGSFQGKDGIEIVYRSFTHAKLGGGPAKGTVVFVAGYSESFAKYGETFVDLFQRGFDIYTMDHRGMGYSGRMLSNPQIVHVANFADYSVDLEAFVKNVVQPRAVAPLYLLANSTGCLIGSQLAARSPGLFKALALVSPLFQLNTGSYPEWLAYAVVSLHELRGAGASYAPGYADYVPEAADPKASRVTRSVARAKHQIDIHLKHRVTIMGGPSNNWVREAIKATRERASLAPQIKVPVLILQASDDFYVKREGADEFCSKAPACKTIGVPDSYHELLAGQDAARDPTLAAIFGHFEAHP